VHLDLAGNRVILRQPAEDPAPQAGERVELDARPAAVHLFDPETSERLN
jgi:hypothetical protein